LASVNHSVAEIDQWKNAGFREDEMRKAAKEAKAKYEDALRDKFFGFQSPQHRQPTKARVKVSLLA
jgi:hypothetical protein